MRIGGNLGILVEGRGHWCSKVVCMKELYDGQFVKHTLK